MDRETADPIAMMAAQLSRLPGIGRKTATRLAYFIAAQPEDITKTIPEMTEDEIHHRAKEIEQEMLMEKRAAASSSPSKRTAG